MIRPLILAALIAAGSGAAAAQTRFERPEACRIKITVPIEIYTVPDGSLPPRTDADGNPIVPDYADAGEAASADYANQLESQIESLWNGPTNAEASVLATTLGTPAVSTDPGDDMANSAEDIRAEWQRYAAEFGVDQRCAYVPCCPIEIDADVRYRAADAAPTPGYHQIGIMGAAHRSFVYLQRNPDLADDIPTDWSNPDHVVFGDRAQTSGLWANRGNARRAPAAHEVGHLMGLDDQYSDASGSHDGHHHDIMATNHGFPFEDALEALRARSGVDCEECCPSRDELTAIMQDLALAVLDSGDMVVTCDREAILMQINRLHEMRRRLQLSNAHPRQKALSGAQIDFEIRRLQRALRDCPRDRPVTGGGDTAVATGGSFTPIPVETSSDGTEWCTYRDGSAQPGVLVPGTPGTTVPPPETPGSTPGGGGDDPRDAGPPGTPGTTPDDGDDDPRDARDPQTPGSTPGGDAPRDTGQPGSIPTGLPGGGEDDGDDPRDAGDPAEDGGEEDDPRDVPVQIHVKARASVIEGGGGQSSEVGGQTIRLLTPSTANPSLPGPGVDREDDDYDREPMQCTTDESGDCVIEADAFTVAGLSGLSAADLALASDYTLEVETPDRQSVVIATDAPLSDTDRQAIGDLAVEGDEIEITDLRVGLDYKYRLDYGLRLGYDWGAAVGIDYVEDNVCRDKQPGPPLGWTPAAPQAGADLPRQTISLEVVR